MLRWIGTRLGRVRPAPGTLRIDRESDVALDPHLANSRAVGGGPALHPDGASTTGTGVNQGFVGRVCGDDLGYGLVTGAEVRAERGARQRR